MILIKRYANRKLYNTDTSRYITLKGLAELIEKGEEIKVVDNETGEDITSVAFSQILVDSERSNSAVSQSLLSQILERGGDAIYTALRRGVDDATVGLEDLQERMRRIVHFTEGYGASKGLLNRKKTSQSEAGDAAEDSGSWPGPSIRDFDAVVQHAVERVFKILDLPKRSDIESLSRNLERMAEAVERLERAVPAPPGESSRASDSEKSDTGER